MTIEKLDKLFQRNDKDAVEQFAIDANEYDMEAYNILVSVMDDDWEYGHGDYTYRYQSVDEFIKHAKHDIITNYDLEEVNHVSIDLAFFDLDSPYDEERVEMDEI